MHDDESVFEVSHKINFVFASFDLAFDKMLQEKIRNAEKRFVFISICFKGVNY